MASNARASRGTWFRRADDAGLQDRLVLDKELKPHELAALGSWHWEIWARDEQLPPQGPWRVWLICAGRGFGKTRAGAEWVRNLARHDPAARIALVGASLGEVRSVMVEGESGILAASPGALAPEFEPSLKRLTWPNGAQAYLIPPASLKACADRNIRTPGATRSPNGTMPATAPAMRGTTCSSACGWASIRACSPPAPRAGCH
ncbi:terminase large subunit domain-containing protein [Parafrankia sp. BMG5.11]|uniref:terminase large subunit domain-containing protein n=1 Tax=Parafrankia sp. BMG5.11 TaxID=222540 RepID=UPI001A9CFAB7|nr:terminase family protein [Parafrankia sp. BMG5.11]